jgi:hypothetical protein
LGPEVLIHADLPLPPALVLTLSTTKEGTEAWQKGMLDIVEREQNVCKTFLCLTRFASGVNRPENEL